MTNLFALPLVILLLLALFNPAQCTPPSLFSSRHQPHDLDRSSQSNPRPTLVLTPSTSPLQADPPVPFLGLFSNPSSLAPGAPIQLSWTCYFCSSLPVTPSVTIYTNSSIVVIQNASINGSIDWRLPINLHANDVVTFVASIDNYTSLPNYTLELPIHAPNPKVVLVHPGQGTQVSQSAGMTIAWTCTECYVPTTVSLRWCALTGSLCGTLANHVPVVDSGIVIPIPDDMVRQDQVNVFVKYDGQGQVEDYSTVRVTA
jgi:hypothetical protein